MESMAATSTASVPKACNGWGETMAAYRFFDNASVDWRAIRLRHGAYKSELDGRSYRSLKPASEKSRPPAAKRGRLGHL